jgi:hypothetical protein
MIFHIDSSSEIGDATNREDSFVTADAKAHHPVVFRPRRPTATSRPSALYAYFLLCTKIYNLILHAFLFFGIAKAKKN